MAPVGCVGMSKEQLTSAALQIYWEEFNKTSSSSGKNTLGTFGTAQHAQNFWNELNQDTGNCGMAAAPLPPRNNCCGTETQAPCSLVTSKMDMQMSGGPPCPGTMQSGMCAYTDVASLSKCHLPPPTEKKEPVVEEVWTYQQKGTSCNGIRKSAGCMQAEVGTAANPDLNTTACGGSRRSLNNAACGGSKQGSTAHAACGKESCMTAQGSELFPASAEEDQIKRKESRGSKKGEVAASKGQKYADFGKWAGSPCDKDCSGTC